MPFFMEKYMGEFAFNKINDVINIVNLYKIVNELQDENEDEIKSYETVYNLENLVKSYNKYFKREDLKTEDIFSKREKIMKQIVEHKEILKKTITHIGEPLLRNRLEEDLNSIGIDFDIDKIVKSLNKLSQQDLKERLKKYPKNIRIAILKKLFESDV